MASRNWALPVPGVLPPAELGPPLESREEGSAAETLSSDALTVKDEFSGVFKNVLSASFVDASHVSEEGSSYLALESATGGWTVSFNAEGGGRGGGGLLEISGGMLPVMGLSRSWATK